MDYPFKTRPFPHQLECFERFKDAKFAALLADMGTGKSKIVIDLFTYNFLQKRTNRVLILAPNDVHEQWANEQLVVHCPASGSAWVHRAKTANKNPVGYERFMQDKSDELRVLCMNFEALYQDKNIRGIQTFFDSSDLPPTIVVDEASRIKNPEAKSVIRLFRLRREYLEGYRYVITGTPVAKSPVDMWSLFEFLQPGYMGCSLDAFTREHMVLITQNMRIKGKLIQRRAGLDEATYKKIRNYIGTVREPNGVIPRRAIFNVATRYGMTDGDAFYVATSAKYAPFKNTDALQRKIAPVTFSVSKKDCLQLPEKVYQRITLELTDEQKRIISELKNHAVSVYHGDALSLTTKAQLGLRVLQVCGGFFPHHSVIEEDAYEVKPLEGANRKLNYILEDLPEIGDQQFIVWAVFTAEVQLLTKELSKLTTVGQIGGHDKKSERETAIAEFKKGNIQGLVCHPQAAGYGLNLQNAGVQYWYSRNYRTEARLQAEDRSHRIGITRSPVYKDLVYDIPFELAVLQSNQEGKDVNGLFVTSNINDLFKV